MCTNKDLKSKKEDCRINLTLIYIESLLFSQYPLKFTFIPLRSTVQEQQLSFQQCWSRKASRLFILFPYISIFHRTINFPIKCVLRSNFLLIIVSTPREIVLQIPAYLRTHHACAHAINTTCCSKLHHHNPMRRHRSSKNTRSPFFVHRQGVHGGKRA